MITGMLVVKIAAVLFVWTVFNARIRRARFHADAEQHAAEIIGRKSKW